METLYTQEMVVTAPRVKVPATTKPDGDVHEVMVEGETVRALRWALARPENAKSLAWRLGAALQVLAGRGVPLEWY